MSKEKTPTYKSGASESAVKNESKIEAIRYITFKKYPGQIMLFGINSETLAKAKTFTEDNIEKVLTPLQLKGVQEGYTVCIDLGYDPKDFVGGDGGDWWRGTC